MIILWFPRLQLDIDKLHFTTWREMYAEFKRLGHEVEIALTGDDKENIWRKRYIKVNLIPVKFFRILSFWLYGLKKFVSSYLRLKPDLVLLDIYSVWFSLPVFLFFSRKQCLFVMDNRTPFHNLESEASTLSDKVMRLYTKLAYSYARLFLDGMTVITDYYKNYICEHYGFSPDRIGVWGSGVNLDAFRPTEESPIKDLAREKFVLFQHGEISYNRGVFEVLKAIKLTGKDDIVLVLLGESVKSNAAEDLKILAQELALESQLIVLPPVPFNKVPSYIQGADCAVMTYPDIEYWNNNNPIKLLEYLSMGKVIICTDIWTFRNVIKDNACGVYVKNNRPETIADAIEFCYQNRDKLPLLGKSGVDIISQSFTWRHQAENIINFTKFLSHHPH